MNKYFFGFEVPSNIADLLEPASQLAAPRLAPTTKVIDKQRLHVTAFYLGSVDKTDAVIYGTRVANSWCQERVSFELNGIGVFGGRKGAHALVVRVNSFNAHVLHSSFELVIHASAKWPYNPHITLAKCEGPSDQGIHSAADAIEGTLPFNIRGLSFVCSHLTLFEKQKGADYEVCLRIPLVE